MSRPPGEFEQYLLFALLERGGATNGHAADADADGPTAPDTATDGTPTVSHGATHGTALSEAIARRTGKEPSPGAVYTALSRMEDRGWVASRLEKGDAGRGGRPRRLYTIRPQGARALRESVQRLMDMADGLLPRLEAVAARADG